MALQNSNALVSFIVKKYLRFDPSQPFISITAILAFAGVAIGVFVLIVAMAIMNGFDKEFEKKLFAMNYPITVYPVGGSYISASLVDELRVKFPTMKFSPFIQQNAIAKKNDSMEGVSVFGVDFKEEAKVNEILAKALETADPKGFEAIIGSKLGEQFATGEKDKITLMFADLAPQGLALAPTIKRFDVVGLFHSGLAAYDRGYIYIPIDAFSAITGIEDGLYGGIHIYSANPQEDIKLLSKALPVGISAIGWWQQNGNFFAALALEKRALFIVLMLIIFVASLNIISSLLMTVMSRRKEIALLLSLGASQDEIKSIFFRLGSIIGFGGIILGGILSAITLFTLSKVDIIKLPEGVYPTTTLPLDLSMLDLSFILMGAALIVLLSSWYPAKKAAEVDALSVLRNE